MALWLVVHRPADGCLEEGTPPSRLHLAILEGDTEEEVRVQCMDLRYGHRRIPERPKGTSPRDWARHLRLVDERRNALAWEFEIVPVGEAGRFVEL